MATNIGIVDYKDLINKEVYSLRDIMNTIVLNYKILTSEDSINNRESEDFEKYSKQYSDDMKNLIQMRKFSQDLVDFCNKTMFTISKEAIENHLYNYD